MSPRELQTNWFDLYLLQDNGAHCVQSHPAHLDKYGILSKVQHGFRASHSCETQLLKTLHDILSSRDRNIQIYADVLDFSKAFDKVPHSVY